MDTLDLKIFTDREILEEDLEQIRTLKTINGIKLSENGKILIVSFPRGFYINNAYLVTRQKEIKGVLGELRESIELLGYKVESIQTLRVDYPYTHHRPEGKSFNSYRQIWEWFSLSGELSGWKVKEIGRREKETYIIQDTLRTGRSRKRILIYNQALRIQESSIGEDKYIKSLEDFPDLPQRTRIEVSQRYRRTYRKEDPNLKEIKQSSYELIEEILFSNLDKAREQAIKELTDSLISSREERGRGFRIETFILKNRNLIFDYEILREAIKGAYTVKRSYWETSKKSKSILMDLEKEEGVLYIGNLKRIENIKKQLKKECRRKV